MFSRSFAKIETSGNFCLHHLQTSRQHSNDHIIDTRNTYTGISDAVRLNDSKIIYTSRKNKATTTCVNNGTRLNFTIQIILDFDTVIQVALIGHVKRRLYDVCFCAVGGRTCFFLIGIPRWKLSIFVQLYHKTCCCPFNNNHVSCMESDYR